MRILFVATGDIAIPSFRRLIECGMQPLALVTQPDKPVGRHQRLTPPAIKLIASEADIPVFQPERIGDIAEKLSLYQPEVIVVMAYGQILRRNIIDLPQKAIINVHASLLPEYRGAACIQAAIAAGDAESGVTVIHIIRELDAGDMLVKQAVSISPDETGGSLHDKLAELAPNALIEALDQIDRGISNRTAQDPARVTYVSKLERADGKIDWLRPAIEIERQIRAYDPWPGTFALARTPDSSMRIKIFPPVQLTDADLTPGEIQMAGGFIHVGCGSGSLVLNFLQPEGSRRMSAGEFYNGRKIVRFE